MDWLDSVATDSPDELHLTELVLPQQANHYGTLFGPQAMALLGKTAYLLAAQYCRSQDVVMASAKNIEFLAPVPVGALLHLRGKIRRIGKSSMTVDVQAAVDTAGRGRASEVLRSSFEMVTVDGVGRPCRLRVPPDFSSTPDARLRCVDSN